MKTFFLLLFTMMTICIYGQRYLYEKDYLDFVNQIKSAKQYHFKSKSVFSYKNGKLKNEKLFSKTTFDSTGNITYKMEHYYRGKNYKEFSFFYDKNHFLNKTIEKSSVTGEYVKLTETGNNDKGQIIYIMTKFKKPEDNSSYDTAFYFYNTNGFLNYEIYHYLFRPDRNDTLYYHYDKKGGIKNTSTTANDTLDDRILDSHGCRTGSITDTIIDPDKIWQDYFKITYVCDSLCNVLKVTESTTIKGRWVVIRETKNMYAGTDLKEQRSCGCNKSLLDKCKGHLTFSFDTKYEYDKNGFISKETELNKRGKIIEIKKYVYETY